MGILSCCVSPQFCQNCVLILPKLWFLLSPELAVVLHHRQVCKACIKISLFNEASCKIIVMRRFNLRGLFDLPDQIDQMIVGLSLVVLLASSVIISFSLIWLPYLKICKEHGDPSSSEYQHQGIKQPASFLTKKGNSLRGDVRAQTSHTWLWSKVVTILHHVIT